MQMFPLQRSSGHRSSAGQHATNDTMLHSPAAPKHSRLVQLSIVDLFSMVSKSVRLLPPVESDIVRPQLQDSQQVTVSPNFKVIEVFRFVFMY